MGKDGVFVCLFLYLMNYNYLFKKFKVFYLQIFVQNLATTSLAQLSSCLEASTEVLIIPEGLNKRFNKAAIQFLQHILTKILNKKLTSSIRISSPYTSVFKRICILDSTAFQLSSVYPGAGGCSHAAGMKIQLEYDLLSGQFLHIHTKSR